MNFNWMGNDGDIYRSLKGIANKGGYFGSINQANFWMRCAKEHMGVHTGPGFSWDDSVELEPGEFMFFCEGSVGANYTTQAGVQRQGWGRKTRYKTWGFVVDAAGVSLIYQLYRSYNDEWGHSHPNGKRTEVIWRRDNAQVEATIAAFDAIRAEREAKIAEAKAQSKYVGEIGERIDIEGVARLVATRDGRWGTTNLYIIKTSDGNTLKYSGTNHYGKLSKITGRFTVKQHTEYNGELQTVINRPHKVESESIDDTND